MSSERNEKDGKSAMIRRGKFSQHLRYLRRQLLACLPNDVKRANRDKKLVAVLVSAHKVGSTWVYNLLRDLNIFLVWPVPVRFRANPRNIGLLDLAADGVCRYLEDISRFRLIKSHSMPPTWRPPGHVKFITVIRDPRDVVISNIFYLENLDENLGGWPELATMAPHERIRHYLEKGLFDLQLMQAWAQHEQAICVRYEDLLHDPVSEFSRAVFQIGLEVDQFAIERAVARNSFRKVTAGRRPGEESRESFFRKGISGDWKNYFDGTTVDAFKRSQGGRWNDLLVQLGYEKRLDWQLE